MNNKKLHRFEFEELEDSYTQFLEGKRASGCVSAIVFLIVAIVISLTVISFIYK